MYQQVESGRDSKKDGKRSLFGEEHETSVVRGSLLVLRFGAKPVDARCAKPALPYIMRLLRSSFPEKRCPLQALSHDKSTSSFDSGQKGSTMLEIWKGSTV